MSEQLTEIENDGDNTPDIDYKTFGEKIDDSEKKDCFFENESS